MASQHTNVLSLGVLFLRKEAVVRVYVILMDSIDDHPPLSPIPLGKERL